MDKRLSSIQKSKAILCSASHKLGIFFFVCFALYLLAFIAICAYIIWPPDGFTAVGAPSLSAVLPLTLSNMTSGAILFILGSTFRDIGRGSSPFSARRIRQIRILGAFFLIVMIANLVTIPGVEVGVQNDEAAMAFYSKPADNSIDFDFESLLSAIVCFALSLILRYGELLQQETDDLL